MKKSFFILYIIFISNAFAQLDDFIKEVQPEVELFEEKSITTSISNTYPVAFWLKDIDKYLKPTELNEYPSSFNNGYYRIKLQSYCLKAGTYGPTYGDGYLMAPLKGKRSQTVYNIVKKSALHPEILQEDIQVLLWGIIYGVKFTDYSLDFQNKVRPLLTTQEIADLSLDIKNIPLDIMPDEVKKVASYYQDFRNTLTNPASSFADIERQAMLQGIIPDDLNSKYIQKGNWAYIGKGFFARAFPETYATTYLELYKPPKAVYTKDSQGRIVTMTMDDYNVEIAYDDEPGRNILSIKGKPDLPIWRFKSVKFSMLEKEKIIENKGWIIRGDGKPLKTKGGYNTVMDDNDPTYEEYQKRLNDEIEHDKEMKKIFKAYDAKDIKIKLDDCKDKFRIVEGIKVNFDETPPREPISFSEMPNLVWTQPEEWGGSIYFPATDWIYYLEGSKYCFDGLNETTLVDINIYALDLTAENPSIEKTVAVPATNGKQRIIVSERKQK